MQPPATLRAARYVLHSSFAQNTEHRKPPTVLSRWGSPQRVTAGHSATAQHTRVQTARQQTACVVAVLSLRQVVGRNGLPPSGGAYRLSRVYSARREQQAPTKTTSRYTGRTRVG